MSEDQDKVRVCPEPQGEASVSRSSVGTLPKGGIFSRLLTLVMKSTTLRAQKLAKLINFIHNRKLMLGMSKPAAVRTSGFKYKGGKHVVIS